MRDEFKFNKDDKARQKIIFGEVKHSKYDVVRFEDLSLTQLNTLIEQGYVDLEENQNNSPTIEAMKEFMETHSDFTAHGYIVTPTRDDYRVSLEGVNLHRSPTKDEMRDFTDMFRYADEFVMSEDRCYAWYD